MESNKIVNEENQILLTIGSSNFTSVSTNNTELTSTSIFVEGLFLQCLFKAIVTILYLCHLYKDIYTVLYLLLSLQMSLQVSIHEDILGHLNGGISTIVHLQLFLLTSLRCEVLQPSLHTYLGSKFLQSSLLVSLRSGILQ